MAIFVIRHPELWPCHDVDVWADLEISRNLLERDCGQRSPMWLNAFFSQLSRER